jgi:hypothetical protein
MEYKAFWQLVVRLPYDMEMAKEEMVDGGYVAAMEQVLKGLDQETINKILKAWEDRIEDLSEAIKQLKDFIKEPTR